jgi:hypothetical protein
LNHLVYLFIFQYKYTYVCDYYIHPNTHYAERRLKYCALTSGSWSSKNKIYPLLECETMQLVKRHQVSEESPAACSKQRVDTADSSET